MRTPDSGRSDRASTGHSSLLLRGQRVSGGLFHFRPTPSLTGAPPRLRRRRGFGRPVPLPPDTQFNGAPSLRRPAGTSLPARA